MLIGRHLHVEPFESPEELGDSWPHADVVLVIDDADFIKLASLKMTSRAVFLPLVAYSSDPSPRRVANAILDGAIDYVAWPGSEAEVIEVVEGAEHRARTQPMRERLAREATAQSRLDGLSRRERQVLACVADGMSNRLIGHRLGISARTVEIHRAHILEKTEARSTSEAIRLAVEAGVMLESGIAALFPEPAAAEGFPREPDGEVDQGVSCLCK